MKEVEKLPLDYRLSNIIEVLRFPLAVAVVFIHSFGVGSVTSIAKDGCDVRIYDILRVGISHGIANVAVPCFFLFSGYLFFTNSRFGKDDYFVKFRKRTRTLLIPYLFWNCIPVLYSLCKRIGGAIAKGNTANLFDYISHLDFCSIFLANEVGGAATIDYYGESMPLALPINYSLWFLRDLMLMVVLSPIVFKMINGRFHVLVLMLLFILFTIGLWPINLFLSITGVFFFYVGAWIRIRKIDVISFLMRFRGIVLFATFLLFAFFIYNNGCRFNNLLIVLGVCFTLILASAASSLKMNRMSKYSFFIYLTHMLFLTMVNIHNNVFLPILSFIENEDMLLCIDYLVGTMMVVFLCVLLQRVMINIMPRVYDFSTGSR